MRSLKILVIVLGVMLVVGFVALVVVIAHRVANRQPAPPSPSAPFLAQALELPAGARIETIAVGPDRVVLHLLFPDGAREIVIVDLASGRRLGTIPLKTQ